jgi:transcriptional regulator with XRE-family HTH domain
MTAADLDPIEWEALGGAIRKRRLERDLTLVDLAASAALSQPFLSQIENGRARPSMTSLYRIARALDTTPQAFFGGPVEGTSAPALVRAGSAPTLGGSEASESIVHLLLAGDSPFHVLEFVTLPQEFSEYWEHDGFEAIYVISGDVEVDLDGAISTLGAGDFLSYPAKLRHRLRSCGGAPVRVLLIETRVEGVQGRRRATHTTTIAGRKRPTHR